MIYLIGGPARCGKSTLAARVRREIDGQVLASDAFIHALKSNLQPAWVPDIFDEIIAPLDEISTPEGKVDRVRRRDEMAWQFYASYIDTAVTDARDDDVLLEGNLWPDYMSSFMLMHRAVFLVDTSPDQARRLVEIGHQQRGNNNWMQDFSDEKVAEWALFNVIRSKRYLILCEQYRYPCFDIAQFGMEGAQQRAFEYLLQKTV